ncbi:hypothetical protein BH23ACT3_BH23ACT3_15230 [soil metagenome]
MTVESFDRRAIDRRGRLRMRRVLGGFAVVVGLLGVLPGSTSAGESSLSPGAIEAADELGAQHDQYVVMFRSTPGRDRAVGATALAGVEVVSSHVGNRPWALVEGEADEIAGLRAHPDVFAVEPNSVVTLAGTPSARVATAWPSIQADPPWGLDRIDQERLPLSTTYTAPSTGAGVRVYVIDDGIYRPHVDFGGRVDPGLFLPAFRTSGHSECSRHGSHVAGTIGGAYSGVAKHVELVPLRVFTCDGSSNTAAVMAAIDWIVVNHEAGTPGVVNMSFGGPKSDVLDAKVASLVTAGLVVVAAAGNESRTQSGDVDACESSPARSDVVITVGATTTADARSSFSNIGPCVDLFAPGSSIVSVLAAGSISRFGTSSGTSMATPHVAGAAALLLSREPTLTPAQVGQRLGADATPDVVTNPGVGSPNLLLYVSDLDQVGSDPPAPDDVSPLAIPSNATFGAAASLPLADGTVTGTNRHSRCEPGEPLHAGVGRGASVWWTFTSPDSGTVTLSTAKSVADSGGALDTLLAAYTGRAVGELSAVASNDDVSSGDVTSRITFQVAAGTKYSVAVDGYDAMPGAIMLEVSWVPTTSPTTTPATSPATSPTPMMSPTPAPTTLRPPSNCPTPCRRRGRRPPRAAPPDGPS